jgi:hypothetical protein
MGLEILKKNLSEFGFSSAFDYSQVFSLLSDGEVKKAFNIFVGEINDGSK